jgi:hypothetical protein
MDEKRESRIKALVSHIPKLTEGQLYWIERVVHVFDNPRKFEVLHSELFDKTTADNLGDALRIHRSFSVEPFSKDKFEFVLENVLNMSGHTAKLAPKGTPEHDIKI